jgi:hypothetical protein
MRKRNPVIRWNCAQSPLAIGPPQFQKGVAGEFKGMLRPIKVSCAAGAMPDRLRHA